MVTKGNVWNKIHDKEVMSIIYYMAFYCVIHETVQCYIHNLEQYYISQILRMPLLKIKTNHLNALNAKNEAPKNWRFVKLLMNASQIS